MRFRCCFKRNIVQRRINCLAQGSSSCSRAHGMSLDGAAGGENDISSTVSKKLWDKAGMYPAPAAWHRRLQCVVFKSKLVDGLVVGQL